MRTPRLSSARPITATTDLSLTLIAPQTSADRPTCFRINTLSSRRVTAALLTSLQTLPGALDVNAPFVRSARDRAAPDPGHLTRAASGLH